MKYSKKKTISMGLIGIGSFYFLFSLTMLNNVQKELVYTNLIFGLICTIAGLLLYSKNRKDEKLNTIDNLNKVFYSIIKRGKCRLTILEFAIEAKIDGKLAREFIEQKATQFSIIPEIDDNRKIIYDFKII